MKMTERLSMFDLEPIVNRILSHITLNGKKPDEDAREWIDADLTGILQDFALDHTEINGKRELYDKYTTSSDFQEYLSDNGLTFKN